MEISTDTWPIVGYPVSGWLENNSGMIMLGVFSPLWIKVFQGLLLTSMQQVLIAFRFYTTGTFEQVIGDLFGVFVFATYTQSFRRIQGLSRNDRNEKNILCHSLRN